jgi:alpha-tubulin suppressor-like RCC1 family protein
MKQYFGDLKTHLEHKAVPYTINNKQLQNMNLSFKAIANSQSLYMSGNNTLFKCTFTNNIPSCVYRRIIKDMSTRAILESNGLVSVFFKENGVDYIMALATSGAIYAWGDNSFGQLGGMYSYIH